MLTSFVVLCGRHRFEVKALRLVTLEIKACPVCGKKLKYEPFTLIPKDA